MSPGSPQETPAQQAVAAIADSRLLPVVVIDDAADAVPLASALKKGGLRCAEITLRTAAAADALRTLAADGELTVGAGTVLTVSQLEVVIDAGAQYVVTPGFSPAIVRRCQEFSVPVFPGVATASDLHAAVDHGLDAVKFFPAEPLGGLGMLNALTAPFPGIRFIPTGGITPASAAGYLRHPAVLAVGGSWMVAPHLIRTGDFAEITGLTAQAVALAAAPGSPGGNHDLEVP
ncbi:MAG TPA: bifunctional 4-hydroxy-2-oxoglutarate aldolase/2-dehydro-3-deoxy-phosphogluconate aldolase [Trebonia sp.]